MLEQEDTGLVLRRCSNGTRELSQYDHEGRLLGRLCYKRSSDGQLSSWAVRHQYSGEGDLLSVFDSLRGMTRYQYDDAHRFVAEVTPSGEKLLYDLDEAGNVLAKPGFIRVELRSGNRLRETEQEVFNYDRRNHLCCRTSRDGSSTKYNYDSFDLLQRVEQCDAAGERELLIELEHDALGRLAELRCGGLLRQFYWDGDRIIAEVQPDGSVRIYTYVGEDSLTPLFFTEYVGLDAEPESGKVYQIFSNQVGMPLHIEDESGAIVWWASRVDPYGLIEVHPTSSIEYNLRWPGHYFDPVTELHINRRRAYDPALGRYLQSDPIGFGGGKANLYGYCTNPLRQVDVLGLHDDDNKPSGSDAQEKTTSNSRSQSADGYETKRSPRLSREDGQKVVDQIHQGLRERDRNQLTTALTELEDGRVVVTSSDKTNGVTPDQRRIAREELRNRGFTDDQILFQNERGNPGYDPPGNRDLSDSPDPTTANHGEQRGIQSGRNQGSPARRQWASSSAEHGGAACSACETAQRSNNVQNETGFQTQGGRFDRGGTDPSWNSYD